MKKDEPVHRGASLLKQDEHGFVHGRRDETTFPEQDDNPRLQGENKGDKRKRGEKNRKKNEECVFMAKNNIFEKSYKGAHFPPF